MKDNGNVAVVEEKRQWKFGGFDRRKTTEMWRGWKRKDYGNLVLLMVESQ